MREQQGSTGVPLSLFISYAHEDEPLRQQLETHLSLLRRQGLIADWHDRQILAGEEWKQKIDEHLETASIILLLVSADFLASDYCYDTEMRRALERHKLGEAHVIPIILRPVDWSSAPFGHLQCLPRDGKSVTESDNLDAVFRDIAQGIRQTTEQKRGPVRSLPSTARRYRFRLLKRVQATWVEGILKHSLHRAVLITLGLHEQPDAIENPWRLVVQESALPPRPLPINTPIAKIYNDADGELLILGEPGAGKTTLLLELARDLLGRAAQDESYPIPVVFNLSSWAQKRQPLVSWIIDELHNKYNIPLKVSQAWMDAGCLILLLDGLDEVNITAFSKCVEAINTYRREHELVPMVVCSRRNEYMDQDLRILLTKAVMIQPLTRQQVEEYLESFHGQLDGLRSALQIDRELQETATTPLMLSILTLAYHGVSVETLRNSDPDLEMRQYVFSRYVQRVLERRGRDPHYTIQHTIQRLSLIAYQMKQSNQMEISPEHMRTPCLPRSGPYRFLYIAIDTLLTGVLFSMHYALLGVLVSLLLLRNWHAELVIGVISFLLPFLCYCILYFPNVFLRSREARKQLRDAKAPIYFWGWPFDEDDKIYHGYEYPPKLSFGTATFNSIMFGCIAGLLFGFLSLLPVGFFWGWEKALQFSLLSVLLDPIMVLIVGLTTVIADEVVDSENLSPSESFQKVMHLRSGRSGALVGLLSGLLSGAATGVFMWFWLGLSVGWFTALLVMFTAGFSVSGVEYLQYLMLRLLLRYAGYHRQFFDYAAKRILLRKVGNGYIFIHRLLLDYFAMLETSSLEKVLAGSTLRRKSDEKE